MNDQCAKYKMRYKINFKYMVEIISSVRVDDGGKKKKVQEFQNLKCTQRKSHVILYFITLETKCLHL